MTLRERIETLVAELKGQDVVVYNDLTEGRIEERDDIVKRLDAILVLSDEPGLIDAFVAGAVCAEANANGISWDDEAIKNRTKRAKSEASRRYGANVKGESHDAT
jgi:hypothetical protein